MSGNQLMLAGAPGTVANYIEDVFSTYLWTGNNTSQSINNGIDLSTKGGLVWIKMRSGATSHILSDTSRGTGKFLSSNTTDAQGTDAQDVTAFNTTGFTVGNNTRVNNSSFTYAGWTFREQPKFFDIVTYTGNGVAFRTVPHNLGSTPGCILIKSTSAAADWAVWHRGDGTTAVSSLSLNTPDSSLTSTVTVNSTEFSTAITNYLGAGQNVNGRSYVAYLFAHNAGGFGTSGSDNVISCGSFTTDGSGNATVTLGWEPQWILFKRTDASTGGDWYIYDTMRGMPNNAGTSITAAPSLSPNTSGAELTWQQYVTATGFVVGPGAYSFSYGSASYIYIAIRRGPMKTPTSATSVFTPFFNTQSAGTQNTTNFTVDTMFIRSPGGGENNHLVSRLQGVSSNTTDSGQYMYTQATNAEASGGITRYWSNIGFQTTSGYSGYAAIYLPFQRAPGFHDVVCYTGTGSATTQTHNLGVAPELLIVKGRSVAANWAVGNTTIGWANYLVLNSNIEARNASSIFNSTAPTSSVFSVGTSSWTNDAGGTYVAYLFASVSGVSKVGSYTGTGTTNQINCGFTGGARLIIIKRTDSTGDWYVYNSASGIVAGNDPYILLNSTAAEVTNTDYVDTYSAGFELSSTAPAGLNANGGTYLFLAIA